MLAAHVNFVKVKKHMPAAHRPPETKLRTESRKQKKVEHGKVSEIAKLADRLLCKQTIGDSQAP